MRKVRWILVMLLISTALWGCGEKETEDAQVGAAAGTEIEVLKDGSIVETITEEFAKDYYDETNLRDILIAEVDDFNRGAEDGSITVDKFESEDGKLTVSIKYPSADIYTAYNTDPYNNKKLFCGTVAEAGDAGYSFDISLTDVKGEETIGKEDILGMGSSKILIAESPSRVKVTGRILYVGENISVSGKNQAIMQSGEDGEALGRYYVIYK